LHQPEKKSDSAQKLPLLGLILLGPLGACGEPARVEVDAPSGPESSTCGDNGAAKSSIYGGIQTEIRWSADDMACDSMLRPDGKGVRLQFVGDISGERLALIIALPDLNRDAAVSIPEFSFSTTVNWSGK